MSTAPHQPPPLYRRQRLTRIESALAARLRESGQPVITPYALFQELRACYRNADDIHSRRDPPDRAELTRRRRNLLNADVLGPDVDYKRRAYRVLTNGDRPAEEVCCLVDPFCCVSHLSAMARYGLTERRPRALHLTRPRRPLLEKLIEKRMLSDYGAEMRDVRTADAIIPLRVSKHPAHVRGMRVSVRYSSRQPSIVPIRDSFARITTIGETFVAMLEDPSACGGMAHVLSVWQEHAMRNIDDIIDAVETRQQPIIKVRAGYILDERLRVSDPRVEHWARYAQRGGSRVLDPERPFAATYSEKWMISLNAG